MYLREAERQVLIALHECAEAGEAASAKNLERQGRAFLSAKRDWTGALASLVQMGLVTAKKGAPTLTSRGETCARRLRQQRPRMYYWYRAYYREAKRSPANAAFCERLFGRDFAQHGFADMVQIDLLLSALELREGERVLEIGCGNGGIAQYISERTGAFVVGIDFMAEAIRQARRRAKRPGARLAFERADMNTLTYPAGSFDAVIAIDTLYFADDLVDLIRRVKALLRPQGRLGALYYHDLGGAEDTSREQLRPEHLAPGRALLANGMPFRTRDLTEADRRHSELKRRLAEELRAQYEAEGNAFIYENRIAEANGNLSLHEARIIARYLYRAEVGDSKTTQAA